MADPPKSPDFIGRDLSTIKLVKSYPRRIEFKARDAKDERRADRLELEYLQVRIRIQNDKIRRLGEEINDTIRMLSLAIDGKAETYDEVKRRISRLKGALEYQGRSDYKE